MLNKQTLSILFLTLLSFFTKAQSSTNSLTGVSARFLSSIEEKSQLLESKLDRKTDQLLERMRKQEKRLLRKASRKDSLKAAQAFGDIDKKYDELKQKLADPSALKKMPYTPYLDTLKTSLGFLKDKLPADQLAGAADRIKVLEDRFKQAEHVKRYVKERKAHLKEQLGELGMLKELKQINKQVYYYSEQITEYKRVFSDPKKMEEKTLSLLRKHPAFQSFMNKHSELASLFRLPGSSGTGGSGGGTSLQGLQTRASVSNLIQQQMGGSANADQMLRDNMQSAQGQLSELRNRLPASFSGGSASDMELPDFKPNSQKTKSFKDRLEFGMNLQSQRGNGILPSSTDLGLSAGYKLNDKSTIGIGGSYRWGWGENIQHIRITHEGVGLRSFIDWQLNGSFWITGGYERNSQAAFQRVDQLRNLNAWQESGLIGIMRKQKVGKKTANMQLLWDFLSYGQVPRGQAVKLRVGYKF